MLQQSHLHGANNRKTTFFDARKHASSKRLEPKHTIGGPNYLQGGWERQLSSHAFFRAVTGGTGNWGWLSARVVTGGTGVNGLK